MINPEVSQLSFLRTYPPLHLIMYLTQIWCNSHSFSYTDAQMAALNNDITHVQINNRTLNICSKTPGGAEHIMSSLFANIKLVV